MVWSYADEGLSVNTGSKTEKRRTCVKVIFIQAPCLTNFEKRLTVLPSRPHPCARLDFYHAVNVFPQCNRTTIKVNSVSNFPVPLLLRLTFTEHLFRALNVFLR